MILTDKEFALLCATPKKECWICEEIITHSYINLEGRKVVSNSYLRINPDIREHLKQIINR
jgi:hypothetical protein